MEETTAQPQKKVMMTDFKREGPEARLVRIS